MFSPEIESCGIGESCTASLKAAVIVTESPDLYGPGVEYVIAAVGEVLSKVTLVASVTAVTAPAVFPARSVAVAENSTSASSRPHVVPFRTRQTSGLPCHLAVCFHRPLP